VTVGRCFDCAKFKWSKLLHPVEYFHVLVVGVRSVMVVYVVGGVACLDVGDCVYLCPERQGFC